MLRLIGGAERRLPAGAANAVLGDSAPAALRAGSYASIEAVDRSVASVSKAWNAAAGTGVKGSGVRDPARPGAATSTSEAVSAAPATRVFGRTERGRYSIGGLGA